MDPALPRVLADDLVVTSIRLLRLLRSLDASPALTRAEASALAVLIHGGGMSLGTLAAHEGVKPPSMTRTVRQLEDRQLVRRELDPSDARGIRLSATARGRRIFEAGHVRLLAPLVHRIEALSAPERQALQSALPLLMRLACSVQD